MTRISRRALGLTLMLAIFSSLATGGRACRAAAAATAADSTVNYPTLLSKATPGCDLTAILQGCINSGKADLHIPAGFFSVSGTITFPGNHPVCIDGAGMGETQLYWATDLGTGNYAIDMAPGGSCPLQLSDLSMLGPNHIGTTGDLFGVAPANMNGVHGTDACIINNCSIGGFYSGVVIDGNHQVIENCNIQNNWYNLYYCKPTDNSESDQYIGVCDLVGARFASVGCSPDATIASMFERCHMGYEPYAIYREPENSNTTNHTWMIGCHFSVVQFEGCGNADFYDASGAGKIETCTFTDCGGWGSRYGCAIPAANSPSGVAPPVGPSMTVSTFVDNTITNYGMTPGDMNATTVFGNTWNVPGCLGDLVSGSTPMASIAGYAYGNVLRDGDSTGVLAKTSGALAVGQPADVAAYFYADNWIYGPAGGLRPVAGVSLTAAAAGGTCVIGTKGVFPVNVAGTAPSLALGQSVYLQPNGVMSSTPSDGPLLGLFAQLNGSTMQVWIDSPQGP